MKEAMFMILALCLMCPLISQVVDGSIIDLEKQEIDTSDLENKLIGEWEYERIEIDSNQINPTSLNECNLKDVLNIREIGEIYAYEINGTLVNGKRIGESNTKICSVDPIDLSYNVTHNSCETIWIKPLAENDKLISVSEGVMIEYRITFLDKGVMILSKTVEFMNFGLRIPDKIILKKKSN